LSSILHPLLEKFVNISAARVTLSDQPKGTLDAFRFSQANRICARIENRQSNIPHDEQDVIKHKLCSNFRFYKDLSPISRIGAFQVLTSLSELVEKC
jgi:hypothetical protein